VQNWYESAFMKMRSVVKNRLQRVLKNTFLLSSQNL